MFDSKMRASLSVFRIKVVTLNFLELLALKKL